MQGLFEQVAQASQFIRSSWPTEARVGLVLGTGLGRLAEQIETDCTLPYADIPHFPTSTVESHTGQLVCGRLNGVPLLAMEGRFHYYEGYSTREITFPVRVMKALGAETLVVTNAAGGMDPQLQLGDVVILEDHINLIPENPLRGVNDDALGPRFPDMSAPYDPALIRLAQKSALELSLHCPLGVLVAVEGPNLETRAEYRLLRAAGADLVSMSTVPEVIVAAHAGLKVLGFSIVTDRCLPDALEPVAIEKILEVAAIGGEKLSRLIPSVVAQL